MSSPRSQRHRRCQGASQPRVHLAQLFRGRARSAVLQNLDGCWQCLHHRSTRRCTAVSVLGIPLVMVRRRDGSVGVLHNVCSHRGNQPITRRATSRARSCVPTTVDVWARRCVARDASHRRSRNRRSCHFAASEHGLVEVSTAVWFDVVFVNLSGDATPFEEFIAPLQERVDNLAGDDTSRPSKLPTATVR